MELSIRCNMTHQHQPLVGGRAKEAAKYPEELCEAICRGLTKEIAVQEAAIRYLCSVKATDKIEDVHKPDMAHEEEEWAEAWDDVSGVTLDPKEVRRARAIEIGYVEEKQVWKTPREKKLKDAASRS